MTDISAVLFEDSQTAAKVNLEITRFDRQSGNCNTPSSAPQLLWRPAAQLTDDFKVPAHTRLTRGAHTQIDWGRLSSSRLHRCAACLSTCACVYMCWDETVAEFTCGVFKVACPAPLIRGSPGNVPVVLSLFPSVVADLVALSDVAVVAATCRPRWMQTDGKRGERGRRGRVEGHVK